MPTRVAVDAMGGDNAPEAVVEGAVRAARRAAGRLEVLLFGSAARIEPLLAREDGVGGLPVRVVDAPEVIEMGESPVAAVKSKPRSSIHLGLGACKQGLADAFASAGNTGAVMAAALFILGRLEGVARPTIPGLFPTTEGTCIVLDVGTNVDCKPEHLVQFGQMGAVYARRILRSERPTVALLNIGEEPGKGNELAKEAYKLLEAAPGIHFRGNIEGRDVYHHAADVVVCDGFVGNIILKLGESTATAFMRMVEAEMRAQTLDADQKGVVLRVLDGVKRRFDYEEYGGAPLLGIDGTVLIGHGSSSARAIERMVLVAAEVAEQALAASIADALETAKPRLS